VESGEFCVTIPIPVLIDTFARVHLTSYSPVARFWKSSPTDPLHTRIHHRGLPFSGPSPPTSPIPKSWHNPCWLRGLDRCHACDFIARFCRTSARLYRATNPQTLRLSSCTLRLCRVNKHGFCTTFPFSRSSFTNTVSKW